MDYLKMSVSHRAPLNNGRGKLSQHEQTFISMHTSESYKDFSLPMERCVESFKCQRYFAVEADTMSLQVSVNHFPVVRDSK